MKSRKWFSLFLLYHNLQSVIITILPLTYFLVQGLVQALGNPIDTRGRYQLISQQFTLAPQEELSDFDKIVNEVRPIKAHAGWVLT